jgi:very-short-patch-repair endonuclease
MTSRAGSVVHRSRHLSWIDRRTVDGIPITSPARTIVDLAGVLGPEALEAAFESARRMGLVSATQLEARFVALGGKGRPGSAKVRALIEAHRAEPALASRLEVRAARLFRASGLPRPMRQHAIVAGDGRRYRLDFAWPGARVAAECDGFAWHGNRLQWKRDRRRTADIEMLGWRTVFVTWDDVVQRPDQTVDRVALALGLRAEAA